MTATGPTYTAGEMYATTFAAHVNVVLNPPKYHCEHSGERHSIALGTGPNDVYLCGTRTELSEFVAQLHEVLAALYRVEVPK